MRFKMLKDEEPRNLTQAEEMEKHAVAIWWELKSQMRDDEELVYCSEVDLMDCLAKN